MRFFSVFTGIGGFDLGLERANWQCVGQVEIDPFCNAVLEKHWPNVWRWSDVKTLTGELVREHCGRIDALVGGPPCQPASVAGQRRGAADDRWLWPDFLRLVSEINPLWVLAENPRGVFSLDVEGLQFGEWLAREFAARGYELLPVELAAEDVGAPHRRERVWFIARRGDGQAVTTSHGRREGRPEYAGQQGRFNAAVCGPDVADADSSEWRAAAERRNERDRSNAGWEEKTGGFESCGEVVADASSEIGAGLRCRETAYSAVSRKCGGNTMADALGVGQREPHNQESAEPWQEPRQSFSRRSDGVGVGQADSNSAGSQEHSRERSDARKELAPIVGRGWPTRPGEQQRAWEEPRVVADQRTAFSVSLLNADSGCGRGLNGLVGKTRAAFKSAMGLATDGIPRDMARWRNAALKACGNAIVPQVAEVLGRMINRFEAITINRQE